MLCDLRNPSSPGSMVRSTEKLELKRDGITPESQEMEVKPGKRDSDSFGSLIPEDKMKGDKGPTL